jgi:hypothetical protein
MCYNQAVAPKQNGGKDWMNSTTGTIHPLGEDVATDTVSIPLSLLQKMSETVQVFEAFQDELEDYLLSQNTAFLARMRQARLHHLEGEIRSLDVLKQELCIE